MSPVLLDTGPLVAFLNRRDEYHTWATEQFDAIAPPLLTCEASIAEACYLLRRYPRGVHAIMRMIHDQQILAPFRIEQEAAAIGKLLDKYAEVPMDFADACIVRMSEQYSDARVLTLDGDFRVYRRHGRQTIALISPNRV